MLGDVAADANVRVCSLERRVLVRVESLTPSQALRIIGDRLLPARSITESALANSGSVTIRRLSLTPGSTISSRPSLVFHFGTSSRTSLINPSPDESPPFVRSANHCSSQTFHHLLHAPGSRALASLGTLTDQNMEQVGVMADAFDLIIGSAANHVAEISQQLQQDCDRVSFGVRIYGGHHVACEARGRLPHPLRPKRLMRPKGRRDAGLIIVRFVGLDARSTRRLSSPPLLMKLSCRLCPACPVCIRQI